jgi:hypothetical protein
LKIRRLRNFVAPFFIFGTPAPGDCLNASKGHRAALGDTDLLAREPD